MKKTTYVCKINKTDTTFVRWNVRFHATFVINEDSIENFIMIYQPFPEVTFIYSEYLSLKAYKR